MNWKSLKVGAFVRLLACAAAFSTAACLPTLTTPIAGIEASVTAGVCEAWQLVTYSSRDTAQTQLEARANNAARQAYCGKD